MIAILLSILRLLYKSFNYKKVACYTLVFSRIIFNKYNNIIKYTIKIKKGVATHYNI